MDFKPGDVTREAAQAVLKDVAERRGGVYSDLNGTGALLALNGPIGGRITFARDELVCLWPPAGPWVSAVIIPGWGEEGSSVQPTDRQKAAMSDAIYQIFLEQ